MPKQQYAAPSVRQLAAVVEEIAPRDPARWETRRPIAGTGGLLLPVSRERAKQLWALVGMWDRAVERSVSVRFSRDSAAALFEARVLRTFWSMAAAGNLRFDARKTGRRLPVASLRIVRDCLAILADLVLPPEVGVALPQVPRQALKTPVASRSVTALYRGLVDMASLGPLERDGTALSYEDRTRLLAMVAIVLDSGARAGELRALRLDDLAVGEAAVGVRRRPQKAGPNRAEEISRLAEVHPDTVRAVLWGQYERMSYATRLRVLAAVEELGPLPEVEWYGLREGSRVAVRRWLKVRQDLVDSLPLEGARTALWVTLAATHLGPPGIPFKGVTEAYTRGMTALNMLMASEHGWEPMPTRMEQLRRAVDPVRLDGPPAG
ncbi:hypothetical protein ACFQ6Q_00320 [Streptomyces sp. NPDC056437]|uniref:hypothetical protein n=1 Tax=Streptomyces sp. NPDC056437 TaxID=3345816 RepID=UPI003675A1F4